MSRRRTGDGADEDVLGAVEFLVADGDADEDLAEGDRAEGDRAEGDRGQSAARSPDGARRAASPNRAQLIIAAAVALVAVVVVLLVRHPDTTGPNSGRPVAGPTTPVVPSFPGPAAPTTDSRGQIVVRDPGKGDTLQDTVELILPDVNTMPVCPPSGDGSSLCDDSTRVPAGFLAAVRARYPGVVQDSAVSESLRPGEPGTVVGLWARRFTGHRGDLKIDILVRRGTTDSPLLLSQGDDGAKSVVASQHNVHGYTVSVEITVPSGHSLPWSPVQQLSADPRLVAG